MQIMVMNRRNNRRIFIENVNEVRNGFRPMPEVLKIQDWTFLNENNKLT